MRILGLILCGMFASCGERPANTPIPVPPQEPKAATELVEVYQNEVVQDAAILKAVRPHLASVKEPALNLYDTATQGLVSLGGEPTAKDVEKYARLIEHPDKKELEKLRAEKIALDKKTDELEAAMSRERDARLRAEAERDQARKDKAESDKAKAESDRQASLANSAAELTKYGTWAVGIGVICFIFGSWAGIEKWVALATVGIGVIVATTARPLIDFFGSKHSEKVLLISLSLVAANLIFAFGWWLWKRRPNAAASDNGAV